MVKEWPSILIGDVFEFKNGLSKGKEFFGQGTPFISYSEVYKYNSLKAADIRGRVHLTKEEISKLAVQKNDVFFTRTSETPEEVGYSAVLLEDVPDCVFNGFVLRARPKNNWLFPGYCKYCFSTKAVRDEIAKRCKFTTRAGITGRALSEIEIPLPPMGEQQAISEVLDVLETQIQNLSGLIEKKRSIRDGALEDLIRHRTRLDGFNDEWATVTFNQVITPKARIGWQGLKKHEYLRNGYSYLIGGADFSHGTINRDSIWYVSKERYDMDVNIQVSENDVLVTKDGTIGKVAIVPELGKPATLNSGVFVFRTNNKLSPTFLFRVLSSSVFREFIDTLSAGSTIKHLYQKDLKNFEFEIPVDKKEQEAIADTLTAMDEEIEALEMERDKMIQIREGAMDDLLTGRVRLAI